METAELVVQNQNKSIQTTQVYIRIDRAIFQNTVNDKYHTKVAETKKKSAQLLEAGFEYVLQKEDLDYFEKCKYPENMMDFMKVYGIISHPLYFMKSKSFMLILLFSISFLILGNSLATASTRFRTVSQTRL